MEWMDKRFCEAARYEERRRLSTGFCGFVGQDVF
jgi:hypothetical protein